MALKYSYTEIVYLFADFVKKVEESLINYFQSPDTPNEIDIEEYHIAGVGSDIYNPIDIATIAYDPEDNKIYLIDTNNEFYGFLSDQNSDTLQTLYFAVEEKI